jgi:hypothetical protein
MRVEGGGLAGGLDLRLPTGDDKNLLGTGATQAKLQFIASGTFARFAPHLNVGYTFSSGTLDNVVQRLTEPSDLPGSTSYYTTVLPDDLQPNLDLSVPDEFNYVFGTEVVVHPLVTISGDILGRSLRDVQRFGAADATFRFRAGNGAPVSSTSLPEMSITSRGTLNLALGIISAKFNVPNTPLLITGSVLFPLSDKGLRPGVTPVVGLDYAFGK